VRTEPVSVLVVGLDEASSTLAAEDGIEVDRVGALSDPLLREPDAIVLALGAGGPLEIVRAARAMAPGAAIVAITDRDHQADGAIALHAGAEDHLVDDELLPSLLPRAVRYAIAMRRMRRDLATVEDATVLPNLRGFAPIAEHHLRMADRSGRPAVFVFIRLDDFAERVRTVGAEAADALAREAVTVLLDAVRDSDVPARIADDTLCVLLTGDAKGAESLVLSRLVEAMAVHDASLPVPRALSLSVGTARYEPGSGASLSDILVSATRGLAPRA